MSLDAQILAALKAGERLTPAIADARWRVLALHSAISRLRASGHTIRCTRRFDRNTRRTWGEYELIEQQALPL